MSASRALPVFLLLGAAAGCGGEGARPSSAPRTAAIRPTEFSLIALDGTPVDSAATRGRATVVLLFTSYDVVSQMACQVAEEVRHDHRPRINVVGIALEAPKYQVLVRAFGESMGLGYPLAMADHATLSGVGPFGALGGVPTWIVLDREGRERFRHLGGLRASELESVLDRVAPGVQEAPK